MSYTRLTREERYTIELLHRQGEGPTEIAHKLNRAASTVSRELSKHASPEGNYCYKAAQAQSEVKRNKASLRYNAKHWSKVEAKIREDWSPEQITGYFRQQNQPVPSHEHIYQYLLKEKESGGELYKHLRHPIKSYRKRGAEKERRGRIKDQRMIAQRPKVVEEKSRIGDWELDTVIGLQGGAVLVTIVERLSRYTLIRKAQSKEALAVGEQLWNALRVHPEKVLTLTADNGKEFAGHKLTSTLLECDYYFADPYASWQRGLNENTNGLIRQYFPKKTSFNHLSDHDVQRVQDSLNSRPRKCLGFNTPNDIFKPPQPVALTS